MLERISRKKENLIYEAKGKNDLAMSPKDLISVSCLL